MGASSKNNNLCLPDFATAPFVFGLIFGHNLSEVVAGLFVRNPLGKNMFKHQIFIYTACTSS